MDRLGLALFLALLLAGCMDGTAGAIGPGGKANALFVEGVEFDGVEARATRTSSQAATVRLDVVGIGPDEGADCRIRTRGIGLALDLAGVAGRPLPLDLPIAHAVHPEGSALIDVPDFAQAAPVRALRWVDRCLDPAAAPSVRPARFDGTLRVLALERRRIEAFLEVEVESEPEPLRSVEAFLDLGFTPSGSP